MANEQDTQPGAGSGEGGTDSAATATAAGIVGKRRGRPKGSGNKAPGEPGGTAISDEAAAKLRANFEQLYDPAVWEGLVSAPADIALAITGDETWNLSDKERKTLAVQAAATARCMAIENPMWLAISMLSVSLITIYGGRTMEYYSKKAKEKQDAENKRE